MRLKNFFRVTVLFRSAQRRFFWKSEKVTYYAILSLECTFSKRESQFRNTKRDILYIKGRIATLTRVTLAPFDLELFLFTLPLVYFLSSYELLPVTFYHTFEILSRYVMYIRRNLDELEHTLLWFLLLYKKSIKYYILKCRDAYIPESIPGEFLRMLSLILNKSRKFKFSKILEF